MYGPPPGPPPSHPYHTGNMSPYGFSNKDPESQPTPPPYVKNGEGVSMPQGTDYSSVSGETTHETTLDAHVATHSLQVPRRLRIR